MASGPEIRMMPTPPPAAVATAAMVSSAGAVRIGLVMVDSTRLGNDGGRARQLAQAKIAVARGSWALAADRLARLWQGDRGDLEVARLLAQVLRELGRDDEAEATLKSAWAETGDGAWEGRRELLLELADLRIAGGRPGDAARALERVLAVEPGNWEALSLLGDAFLDAGHAAEAVNAYRESISSNPFEATTWWNLATALERAGERVGAAEALGGWLKVAGEVPERAQVEEEIARLRASG